MSAIFVNGCLRGMKGGGGVTLCGGVTYIRPRGHFAALLRCKVSPTPPVQAVPPLKRCANRYFSIALILRECGERGVGVGVCVCVFSKE